MGTDLNPTALFLLGIFALLATLSGAVAGEIYGRKAEVVMWGSGPKLAAALGELPVWLYVVAIAPAVACYLLWPVVSRGAVLILPGLPPSSLCIILWVTSFVALSDLRTRLAPEIVTLPFFLAGLLHGLPSAFSLTSSVEAAATIMAIRYVSGAAVLALSILLPRLEIQRVGAVVFDGDWILAAACASWAGMQQLPNFMLLSVLIPFAIVLPTCLPGVREPARRAAVWFLDATYITHDGQPRPPGIPLAGPLMLGLVLQQILLHTAGGRYQPALQLLHLLHPHSLF